MHCVLMNRYVQVFCTDLGFKTCVFGTRIIIARRDNWMDVFTQKWK
jgi:hypothetical protein